MEPEKKKKKSSSKKSVASFLEEKEKASKCVTLTQLFNNPPPVPSSKPDSRRMVLVACVGGYKREEFDPERDYTCPLDFKHKECKECNLSYCQCVDCDVDLFMSIFRGQLGEMNERERFMIDQALPYLPKDHPLDEEWMEQQDPIWAQLRDHNLKIENAIGKHLRRIEGQALSIRYCMEHYGVQYPDTPLWDPEEAKRLTAQLEEDTKKLEEEQKARNKKK